MSNDIIRDERRRNFYVIDNDIIDKYGEKIGVYGIAMYSLIARYANQNGESAFPSYRTITRKLCISRPKAIETINLLVSLNLITKEKRYDSAGDSTSNLYALVDLGSGKRGLLPSNCNLPPGKPDLPQVVNVAYQGGKRGLPDQDVVNKTQIYKDDDDPASPETPQQPDDDCRRRDRNELNDEQPTATAEQPDNPTSVKEDVALPFTRGAPADPAYAAVKSKLQENRFGHIAGATEQIVKDLWSKYDHAWFDDAIVVCLKSSKPTLAYLEGILKRWAVEGKGGYKANGSKPPATALPPLTLRRWCFEKYDTDNPKFVRDVSEELIHEQYQEYRQQYYQQQAH